MLEKNRREEAQKQILDGENHLSKPKVIALDSVFFHYPDQKNWTLESVNFELEKGDFLLILGPNGGGKTTLIKLLLGIHSPQKGQVEVLNHPPKQVLEKIGYVPQIFGGEVHFPITVFDVVKMGKKHQPSFLEIFPSVAKKQNQERVQDWLERLNLSALAEKKFGHLSGGERQKVLLARAMMADPEILILDEPTNHIDASAKEEFCKLLSEFTKNRTVVMVSHDLGALPERVNKLGCVDKKLVIHKDLHSAHYHSPHQKETYLCLVDYLAEHNLYSQGDLFQRLMNQNTTF